jgi:hypothetical protein
MQDLGLPLLFSSFDEVSRRRLPAASACIPRAEWLCIAMQFFAANRDAAASPFALHTA